MVFRNARKQAVDAVLRSRQRKSNTEGGNAPERDESDSATSTGRILPSIREERGEESTEREFGEFDRSATSTRLRTSHDVTAFCIRSFDGCCRVANYMPSMTKQSSDTYDVVNDLLMDDANSLLEHGTNEVSEASTCDNNGGFDLKQSQDSLSDDWSLSDCSSDKDDTESRNEQVPTTISFPPSSSVADWSSSSSILYSAASSVTSSGCGVEISLKTILKGIVLPDAKMNICSWRDHICQTGVSKLASMNIAKASRSADVKEANEETQLSTDKTKALHDENKFPPSDSKLFLSDNVASEPIDLFSSFVCCHWTKFSPPTDCSKCTTAFGADPDTLLQSTSKEIKINGLNQKSSCGSGCRDTACNASEVSDVILRRIVQKENKKTTRRKIQEKCLRKAKRSWKFMKETLAKSTDAASTKPTDDNDTYKQIVDIATKADEDPLQKWSQLSERLMFYPREATFQDESCRTPLSYVCEWGNDVPASVVRDIILCYPEAVSMPDKDGKYPLHYYVSSNKGGKWQRTTEVLQLLLDHHHRATKEQDKAGNTPLLAALELAANAEHAATSALNRNLPALHLPDLLKALLIANPRAASIPNTNGSFPLHCASKGRDVEVIELLIKYCPDALKARNLLGLTPLSVACRWNASIGVLSLLLSAFPEAAIIPDTRGENPISYIFHTLLYPSGGDLLEKEMIASHRRTLNTAASMQELDGEVKSQWINLELLARAAYHNSISSPLPNNTMWRAVHALCALDVPPELVRFALRLHRDEAFDRDDAGRLPIHIAAATPVYVRQACKKEAKHSLVRYLLYEDDSVVKIIDNAGRLPIHYATEMHKSWEQGGVKYLVRAHPSSLRERDEKSGLYPFMLASMQTERTDKNSNDRRSRAERKVRNKFPLDWDTLPMDRQISEVKAVMEEEEVEELDSVFHLIRSAPDLLLSSMGASACFIPKPCFGL